MVAIFIIYNTVTLNMKFTAFEEQVILRFSIFYLPAWEEVSLNAEQQISYSVAVYWLNFSNIVSFWVGQLKHLVLIFWQHTYTEIIIL